MFVGVLAEAALKSTPQTLMGGFHFMIVLLYASISYQSTFQVCDFLGIRIAGERAMYFCPIYILFPFIFVQVCVSIPHRCTFQLSPRVLRNEKNNRMCDVSLCRPCSVHFAIVLLRVSIYHRSTFQVSLLRVFRN